MEELKPYKKVIVENCGAVCAIYEPHPFRKSAFPVPVDTGIEDTEWCWVFYDWCGNPIGISEEMPNGTVVSTFTAENIGSESLAQYLNKEDSEHVEAWQRRTENA